LPTVTLYSKPDCPLCDDARQALERVRERAPFQLVEIDITTDGELETRLRERIPVVALDGDDLFDFHVDEEELERRVAEGALAP
jgi:glutaredoxin